MPNIPVVAFFIRYWMLIAFMLATNWTVLTPKKFACLGRWELDEMKGGIFVAQTPFEHFGTLLYIPPFASAVLLVAMFAIHLRYRKTIDADAHGDRYLRDWRECTAFQRVAVSNAVFVGLVIAFCILCSALARGEAPFVNQVDRWHRAEVNPRNNLALDVAVKLFQRNLARYQTIQAMRQNGVPAPILFCLHYRESDNDFHCHAHEGSSLQHRTRDEPKGRLPHPEPPYTFEQSAEDAYYVCEHPPLDRIDWTSTQAALDKMESFNGFGYRRKGIAAPYLFSGTSLYARGKYVRDGVFDRTALDQQLGCVAILKRMQARGVALSFASFDVNAH